MKNKIKNIYIGITILLSSTAHALSPLPDLGDLGGGGSIEVLCPQTVEHFISNGMQAQTPCFTCTDYPSCPGCQRTCTTDMRYTCTCNSGYIPYYPSEQCECVTTCPAGQYGDGVTCTACPFPGTSQSGTNFTNIANNAEKRNCYIPKNTSVTDESGTYEFTSNCNYQE